MNRHTGALSFQVSYSMFSKPFFGDIFELTLDGINACLGLRIIGWGHSSGCRERGEVGARKTNRPFDRQNISLLLLFKQP